MYSTAMDNSKNIPEGITSHKLLISCDNVIIRPMLPQAFSMKIEQFNAVLCSHASSLNSQPFGIILI